VTYGVDEPYPDEERYLAAYHAMQSGVAFEMNYPERISATKPKHLRVGINGALVQDAAIVKLLIDKGIFTMEEYWKSVADEMDAEVARYEKRAQQMLDNPNVSFR